MTSRPSQVSIPNDRPAGTKQAARTKAESSRPVGVTTPKRAPAGSGRSRSRDESSTMPVATETSRPSEPATPKVRSAGTKHHPTTKPTAPRPSVDATPITTPAGTEVEQQSRQTATDIQAGIAPLLFDPGLSILAAALDDIEGLRKAQSNRLRILVTSDPDEDGVVRGFGLPLDDPSVNSVRRHIQLLSEAEKELVHDIEKMMGKHPLGPWVKAQKGLGYKTIARLLGAIGDPYWNGPAERPRMVSELFAYCGVAGPGYKKRRGVKANWNDAARMRLWNIVQPIIKTGGPYRLVYDDARERYADAVHIEACERCGPKGHPAAAGSQLSLAHQHARAIRLVMREVLRDLWLEGKRLHEHGTGQTARDTQVQSAGAAQTDAGHMRRGTQGTSASARLAEELEQLAEAEARGEVDSPPLHRHRIVKADTGHVARDTQGTSASVTKPGADQGPAVTPGTHVSATKHDSGHSAVGSQSRDAAVVQDTGQPRHDTHQGTASVTKPGTGKLRRDAQTHSAGAAKPSAGHSGSATQGSHAGRRKRGTGQSGCDTQSTSAGAA